LAKKLIWVVPLIFIGALFYWPVIRVLSLGANGWVLDSSAWSASWFTLWQTSLSTLIALLLGLPVAHLLYRRTFFGRRLARGILTVPFVLPVIVVAIGFVSVRRALGLTESSGVGDAADSIPWIIAAHVFFNLAIAVRTVGAAWSAMDAGPLEAARLDGADRFRVFWSIQLPQLRGSIAAAGALIFLYCLASFGTVLILGGGLVHSIETEIYFSAEQYLDLGRTGALAALQLIMGVGAFAVASRLGSAQTEVQGVDLAAQPKVSPRDWFSVVASAFVLVAVLAPMVAVVWQSFIGGGLANYENLAGQGARNVLNISLAQAAGNSLRNLTVTLAISVGLGCFVARALWRRGGFLLELIFSAPLAVSSVVLGLGYLLGFAQPPLALRDSWLAVPIAQSLVIMPLVIRIVHSALAASDSELSEAASIDGANGWQSWWRVEVAQIRQSLATAIVFASVAAIGEFGAASLLVFGDQETLPTVLYRLIARPGTQNFGMAMAASSLLIALTMVAVLVAGFTRENEPKPRHRQSERA
jgi:thiamine transport system permease protein